MTGKREGPPIEVRSESRSRDASQIDLPSFLMMSGGRNVVGVGIKQRLAAGGADTLAQRVSAFFDTPGREAQALLVGALPFARGEDDYIFEPAAFSDVPPHAQPWPTISWVVQAEPSIEAYQASVSSGLERMAAEDISKIVLSRSLNLEADSAIDPLALSAGLGHDANAVRFMTSLGRNNHGEHRRMVGATPELLVSKAGDVVVSSPLAGSAKRSPDADLDAAAARTLEQSDKDRREHRLVVEAILDVLTPYCRDLTAPIIGELRSTQAMWHLGTHIEGRLKRPEEVSSAELAAALHPTPAVCGAPRDRAARLIAELEGYDRGFYAGAVGWTQKGEGAHRGDGEWYVTLRCAEVSGSRARIYAGAGIVPGSTPEAESRETSAKFQTLLRAIGIDETGAPRREDT